LKETTRLTPFAGLTKTARAELDLGCQLNFFSYPENSTRYRSFMTSPAAECTLGRSKNPKCGPAAIDRRPPGKVTDAPDLAIGPGADIILGQENYRSFLDIYDLVGRIAGLAANNPGPGASHER
jgi:hypothetical protein